MRNRAVLHSQYIDRFKFKPFRTMNCQKLNTVSVSFLLFRGSHMIDMLKKFGDRFEFFCRSFEIPQIVRPFFELVPFVSALFQVIGKAHLFLLRKRWLQPASSFLSLGKKERFFLFYQAETV